MYNRPNPSCNFQGGNEMRTLYLPLNKQWYEMIESGVKNEEYREIKPYWINRFRDRAMTCADKVCNSCNCALSCFLNECKFKQFECVRFSYGYTKRTMMFEIESITIGKGKQEWGAPIDEEVFIIKLGKRL